MTTWKNNGETRPSSCRKNDATRTSLRRCRYFWIAARNQVMSNRRVISDNPARRVIWISWPSQTATSSSRVIRTGRCASGDCTSALSPSALASRRNPPSRSNAMAGKGVLASRDQSVRWAFALSPRSLAHRSISGAPIFVVPSRCLICSRSAATPCKCSNVTRDSSPGSADKSLSVSVLTCVLRGLDVASNMRLRQQRLLGWWLIGNWCRTVTIARRREARCHELAEQRGRVRAITCRRGVAAVVAAHRGDCDGLAIGNCDGLVIDDELEVCLEVGDCQGIGQTRHRDQAVVVGDRDCLAVGRVDENLVHLTIAAGPTSQVEGDLFHVSSG